MIDAATSRPLRIYMKTKCQFVDNLLLWGRKRFQGEKSNVQRPTGSKTVVSKIDLVHLDVPNKTANQEISRCHQTGPGSVPQCHDDSMPCPKPLTNENMINATPTEKGYRSLNQQKQDTIFPATVPTIEIEDCSDHPNHSKSHILKLHRVQSDLPNVTQSKPDERAPVPNKKAAANPPKTSNRFQVVALIHTVNDPSSSMPDIDC